jgi:hypothetical protein
MKRKGTHSIASFASRGGLSRGNKKRFKPPHEKKALSLFKEAEAVVVILASGRSGLQFPQADVWEQWASTCKKKIGFVLYAENQSAVPDFWKPFTCPLTGSSAWGEFSLVKAELHCLSWAFHMYEKAKWFYVVSGDSIPTKRCAIYIRGPESKSSVLGFPRMPGRVNYGVTLPWDHLYEHAQWKVLTRAHVALLCDKLLPEVDGIWRSTHRQLKNKMCCAIAPDEWLIGTFLRVHEKDDVDWSLGTCMMELEFEDELRSCCNEFTGHAVQFAWGDPLITTAIADPSSFAIRKLSVPVKPTALLSILNK